ncbi:separase, partial [Phenoliferia sp. Uapishka_3]
MQHQCSLSNLTFDLSTAAAAAEIETLCTQDARGQDGHLRSYAPQYLAMSHLWLAFHAHQARQDGASEATHTEARQALKILRTALDGDIPPSPSAPKGSPLKEKEKVVVKRKTVVPPTVGRGAAAFKTPLVSRTLAEWSAYPFNGHSESMANLLGALGYTLLRISYLKFLRRLAAKLGSRAPGAFVTTSAHLGDEYARLGKTSRAGLIFAQAESRIQQSAKAGNSIPQAAHIAYLTLYAGYLAALGNHDRSSTAYSEALAMAELYTPDESGLSTTLRIVERTLRLQRTASASTACSAMLQRRGDLTRSLQPAMQAMRLLTRALNNISRLSTAPTVESTPPVITVDTFTAAAPSDPKAPLPDLQVAKPKSHSPSKVQWPNTGLAWLIADSLARAILRVAMLHSVRGTPKSAEYFADHALSFAEDLGSSRLSVRALAVRTEVRLHSGKLLEAQEDLNKISLMLGPATSCPEAIEAQRLRGDLHMRTSSIFDAHEEYLEAQKELDAYALAAAEGEPAPPSAPQISPTRLKMMSPASAFSSEKHDNVLPAIQAYLLCVRVGLLRLEDRQDESQALLSKLAKLAVTEEDKADEFKLLASIQFQDLLIRFASDPVLGMLPESVLSIPTLSVPSSSKAVSPRHGPSLLNGLREIETLLSRAMAYSVSRSQPAKLRELSLLTASHRALYTSAGRPSKRAAATVATTLDLGLAVTLRRDMLDAIDFKLAATSAQDDLTWPAVESPKNLSQEEEATQTTAHYWASIRERYRVESAEASLTDGAFSTLLPSNWTVISLHLTVERDCMLLVRHRRDAEPLVFKLPLDRVARREGDDDGLTFDMALEELQEIISASNAGTQRAKDVSGKEDRVAWWKERKELDTRLASLTEGLEDAWLGAFKSVFMDGRHLAPDAVATFKSRVERILKRSIVRAQEKKVARFKLDDDILACLAALPPTARDEDIEDLFYFVMESFQFTGVPVAYDEIDVDQVAVDLRTALEELHGTRVASTPSTGEHTFLLLDKSLQSFPWESIPCLRGRSVSRLPSLAFLRDRIDLARLQSPSSEQDSCDLIVDSKRTSFVLNPSGDLKNTQSTFEPWLDSMKGKGWGGIVGRAPSDLEMKVALSTKELFLYFGHGGAEQYVRSQTVRHLPRCAVTMLWGCSSGLLKDLGDYDPIGTPYHYMIAGCPALVANLWDVTDKDIDKLSQAVFRKTGLHQDSTSLVDGPHETLSEAVASSRNVCNLQYLNGAATVVYGIPVRFSV